jgi:hypothetical protein
LKTLRIVRPKFPKGYADHLASIMALTFDRFHIEENFHERAASIRSARVLDGGCL